MVCPEEKWAPGFPGLTQVIQWQIPSPQETRGHGEASTGTQVHTCQEELNEMSSSSLYKAFKTDTNEDFHDNAYTSMILFVCRTYTLIFSDRRLIGEAVRCDGCAAEAEKIWITFVLHSEN